MQMNVVQYKAPFSWRSESTNYFWKNNNSLQHKISSFSEHVKLQLQRIKHVEIRAKNALQLRICLSQVFLADLSTRELFIIN